MFIKITIISNCCTKTILNNFTWKYSYEWLKSWLTGFVAPRAVLTLLMNPLTFILDYGELNPSLEMRIIIIFHAVNLKLESPGIQCSPCKSKLLHGIGQPVQRLCLIFRILLSEGQRDNLWVQKQGQSFKSNNCKLNWKMPKFFIHLFDSRLRWMYTCINPCIMTTFNIIKIDM